MKANAEKRKLRIGPASGVEIQSIVKESMNVSEGTVKRAQALIFGKSS
jgi:hypothetical protein